MVKKREESNPEVGEQLENGLVSCLRNEVVTIKHIPKQTGHVKDPKHVLFGGMSENASRVFTVPLLRSGALADVLTKKEKEYLEYIMGLEPNALSVYKKVNNFWETANTEGVSTVTLHKHDNKLNLADPIDYIKYKILLANKDKIAPSLEALQELPKATYEFVIVSDEDSYKKSSVRVNTKKQSYKEFGKIEDNKDILRMVIETIEGRPTASTVRIETLQAKVDDLIQANAGLFLKTVTDPLLSTKVLIKKANEAGVISKRGDFYYVRADNTPLCNNGQDPTLSIAARYLNEPKHQELKFSIEAKVKEYDNK